MLFVRFRAANYQFAAQELLVVQLCNRSLGFLDGLHLHKRKSFRSLVVAVADYLRVLNVSDAVKQVEQVTLGRVEGQIANVKPG